MWWFFCVPDIVRNPGPRRPSLIGRLIERFWAWVDAQMMRRRHKRQHRALIREIDNDFVAYEWRIAQCSRYTRDAAEYKRQEYALYEFECVRKRVRLLRRQYREALEYSVRDYALELGDRLVLSEAELMLYRDGAVRTGVIGARLDEPDGEASAL